MSRFIYKNSEYSLVPKCKIIFFWASTPPRSHLRIVDLDNDHFLWRASLCHFRCFERGCLVWFLPGDSAASWNCLGVTVETRSGREKTWPINESASDVGSHRRLGLCGREWASVDQCLLSGPESVSQASSHSWPAEGFWGPRLTLLNFSEFYFTGNGFISF